MSTNVHEAAARLYRSISAPPGALNTIAGRDGSTEIIRVLVDPMYWGALPSVPDRFDGFKVVVEQRQQTLALH